MTLCRILPGLIICLAFVSSGSRAAPAMTGQTCLIRAEVLDVAERHVARDPELARRRGVPRSSRYIDVILRPLEVTHLDDGFDPSCTGEIQVFQTDVARPPAPGSCISAKARYAGDEFRIGTWLTDIAPAHCD